MAVPFWCINGRPSTSIEWTDHHTFTAMGEIEENSYG